jgi:hypothetical protein
MLHRPKTSASRSRSVDRRSRGGAVDAQHRFPQRAPRHRGAIVLGYGVGSVGGRVITIALRGRDASIKARR